MKTPFLKKQVIKIFQKFGLSKDHALISTNALINAELVGAYGHGLSRLKMYCDRISKKVINPKPKIKIKKISSSISHIDANNSIGFVAADIAIKKANSSAGIPVPTRLIEELVYGKDKSGGVIPGLAFSKDLVAFAGGLPIRTKSGVLLGAIGVSGASADEDEQCAAAAIKAIEDIL